MFPKRSAFVSGKFSKNFFECKKLKSQLIAEIFPISVRKVAAIIMSLKCRVLAYRQITMVIHAVILCLILTENWDKVVEYKQGHTHGHGVKYDICSCEVYHSTPCKDHWYTT